MLKISQLSKYHKVGQGLFYSANIKDENSLQNIKYIIDCGTSKGATELKLEIEEYLNKQTNNSFLDILIISHFHLDHISGLKQLLEGFDKKNIQIKNFFIPYYTEMQRNYLYIYWYNKLNESEKWVLDFILNPVGYLENFKVVINLIFVHPSDKDNMEIINDAVPPLSDDNSSLMIMGTNVINIESENTSKLLNLYHLSNVKITILALFEFDFWVKKCSPDKLKEFTESMNRIISNGISLQTIAKKVSSDKRVYTAYQKLQKDFNDTSLCVLISNVNEAIHVRNFFKGDFDLIKYESVGGVRFQHYRNKIKSKTCKTMRSKYFGYLFTGDINFSAKNDGTESDTYIDFLNHYQNKLKKVQFLTVPHHGSRHNWDNRLLSHCNYPISIVSSAQTGKYGHPDYIVVRDIESHGWAWANEKKAITILHRIIF